MARMGKRSAKRDTTKANETRLNSAPADVPSPLADGKRALMCSPSPKPAGTVSFKRSKGALCTSHHIIYWALRLILLLRRMYSILRFKSLPLALRLRLLLVRYLSLLKVLALSPVAWSHLFCHHPKPYVRHSFPSFQAEMNKWELSVHFRQSVRPTQKMVSSFNTTF